MLSFEQALVFASRAHAKRMRGDFVFSSSTIPGGASSGRVTRTDPTPQFTFMF